MSTSTEVTRGEGSRSLFLKACYASLTGLVTQQQMEQPAGKVQHEGTTIWPGPGDRWTSLLQVNKGC